MDLPVEPYSDQVVRWPKEGRHILAQFDAENIVVYQAYEPAIGRFAAENGYFGGGFKLDRMSWIKTNFLWMMYRSEWGTQAQQEVTLAVKLKRDAFETILRLAVHSRFIPEAYKTEDAWNDALRKSPIRLQWDPDHHPNGAKQERRAVQLGLSGECLAKYAQEWLSGIEDISEFVREQRMHVVNKRYDLLVTPREEIYRVADPNLAKRLMLDA